MRKLSVKAKLNLTLGVLTVLMAVMAAVKA